jgi:S-DNA-T family DNA segregation ATPase FtsK/SpoIIIE
MALITLIDEQQSLLSDYTRSVSTYIQIQKAAETQLKQEIAALDGAFVKTNQQADTLRSKIEKTHEDAIELLKKGDWQRVMTRVKPLPPSAQTRSQPSSEMSQCAEMAEKALDALRNRLVRDSRYPQSIRKSSAIWYPSIGLLVGVIAFFICLLFTNPGVAFLVGMILGSIVGGTWYLGDSLRYDVSRHYQTIAQSAISGEYWHRLWLKRTKEQHEQQVTQCKAKYQPKFENSTKTFNQQMAWLAPRITDLNTKAKGLSPDWAASDWNAWIPTSSQTFPTVVQIGNLAVGEEQYTITSPALFPFPGQQSLIFKADGSAKAITTQAIQSILLRLLATIPPGKLRFTFLDPLGLGQNVAPFMHLYDDDEKLITSKAWTEPQHIEQRLADLTEQMETVIQKYLRNQYQNIEEYNQQAGEVEEPYRVLVVFDFPTNFSEVAARRLLSIAANGPRCGVYTVILIDTAQPPLYGFNQADLERIGIVITWNGQHFVYHDKTGGNERLEYLVQLDTPPSNALFERIVKTVGLQAKTASKIEVPFAKMIRIFDSQLTSRPVDYPGITKPISPEDPATWWVGETSHALLAPLGRAGANKVQSLRLSKDMASHTLVVGKTRSGKSTMLHTLITCIALFYDPREIELYLIDFREGVEFKIYADTHLPHARVIAIESEREFGLSVLQRLNEEIKRRGELFNNAQGQSEIKIANLPEYRQKTGQVLPRILLIVDEFQKFFVEDDALASQAGQILDNLARQGIGFGIHLLLSSQTLSGVNLPRSAINQMGVRIALQCNEGDSRLILADDNHEARFLNRPGEAIYNDQNGRIEGNTRFQVAWLSENEHKRYLEAATAKARQAGFHSQEQVVFEGNQAAEIENKSPLFWSFIGAAKQTSAIAWLGEPIAIKNPPITTVQFRQQSGTNLLMVGQQEQEALGMFITIFTSLLAQTPPQAAEFHIIHFTPLDAPHAEQLDHLGSLFPRIRITRRRDLPNLINQIATEVDRRIETEGQGLPSIYLGIFGLQRARDLRQEEDLSYYNNVESAPNPAKQFSQILREGPDLKVHTIAWCDTLNNLNRTLERRAMREFGMRAIFQMSADDSSSLIDVPLASKLGMHRALLYNEDEGRIEKFRPFDIPKEPWLAAVSARLLNKER